MHARLLLPFVLAALLALVAACNDAGGMDAAQDIAVIKLRVWQDVDYPEQLHVPLGLPGSARDAIGTIALVKDGRSTGYAAASVHHYSDLVVAGVGLRIWQRAVEPERIFVQACASTCPERFTLEEGWAWRPLGMTPLPLDDGRSPDGRYRFGDITIAVPRGNPELLEERERLLALRDVLEGGSAALDWSVGTPTASWEGVTVSGSPPRVTGLNLSERGLNGEIWGYLGDFAELTELRLDGNALTGTIPSAMSVLSKLTDVYLGGNDLTGCIPPPLRRAPNHDLDALTLPDCPEPVHGHSYSYLGVPFAPGTYLLVLEGRGSELAVFDVPGGASLLVVARRTSGAYHSAYPHIRPRSIFDDPNLSELSFRDPHAPETVWLYLDGGQGYERERSPYSGCVYDCGPDGSPAALIEKVAASAWAHTIGDDGWVWP